MTQRATDAEHTTDIDTGSMTEPPRPTDDGPNGRWRAVAWIAAYVALTALVLVMMRRSDGRFPDDTYIFYRYARNIATGEGWVFNPGDSSSNGATAPLWALILSGAYLLRRDMESNGWLLYAMCLSGAALLTFSGLRRCGWAAAGVLAAVMIALNPILLWVRGMETALFLLLVVAVLHQAVFGRRDAVTGALGGLLVLVRPEGVLLLVLVFGWRWWSTKRLPWTMPVATLAVAAPWAAFSWIAFGTPVAGTFAAKTAQSESGFFGPQFAYLRYFWRLRDEAWSRYTTPVAVLGLVIGLRDARARTFVLIAGSFAALQLLLYGLVVRPPVYHWYYSVTYWMIAVLAAIGIEWIARQLGALAARFLQAPEHWATRFVIAAAGIVLVVAFVAGQERGARYEGYREAAEWIDANSTEQQTISAAEIGVLGWHVDRPIVDFLGLLSRQSADEVAQGDLSSWLEREQPDFYVQHVPVWDMEAEASSLPWFASAYRPVFESSASGHPHSRVRVFERVRSADQARDTDQVALITSSLEERFLTVGVELDAESRAALGRLLQVYVADGELQERFDPDGVDLTGLVDWATTTDDEELLPYRSTYQALSDQLDGTTLVAPLV